MAVGPVLVVDDDTVSRHVLIQALANAELPHVAVGSGTEALAQIEKVQPSLVLLDLVMPPPDGYQILRILRAREETRDLPVVVLTALEADEEIAKAFEAGADDFVRKPFKPVELVARIRGQLRLRGAIDALEKKGQDARLVLELTQALASNLDFRGILFTVVQRIAEVARVDRVSIVLVREAGDVGYVVAASDDEQLRDLPIDLAKYPEIQQVLSSREPLVVPDIATHPLLEIVRHEGHRTAFSSLAILPILYEGRPMGVLFLRAKHAFTFGEAELELCKTVSNAMAIALRNARVMQSLRDQTQQVTVARFEAERRLRTLQRYADFFESAADGIIVIDAEGHLLFSNPRARAITGYGETDMRGRKAGDLFAQEDAALAHDLKLGFGQGQYPQNLDIRVRRKNGSLAVLNFNFNSVLREEGVVLCTFRDVTQERAVESELHKTKDFLQRIIDSSVDAIVSADLKGRILLANPAAERIYGIPVPQLVNRDVSTLYPEGVARDVMRLIRSGGGRVEGLRTEVLDQDGGRVPVSLSAALLYDGDAPVGSVGIFTDLREKMRMEQRLAQAQEQILSQERQAIVAELAGAAAHELNQPLTSVMGYAELLKRRLEPHSSAYAAAEVIFNEAERMAEIVRKIGKITRYETKSYVGRARILDLDRSAPASTPKVDGDKPAGELMVMPKKVTKKNESGAREAVRSSRETGSSPPTSTRTRDLGARGDVPAAWLDQLLAAVLALPLGEGQRAVVTNMVEALAAILPEHAVGACFAPEPGSAPHGQVVVTRLPAGAVASPPGIDPTRVFPSFAHECVVAVRGTTTGSTLHLASNVDPVNAESSSAAHLLDRASAALGHALHLSRQLTSPGVGPRDSQDFEERMIQADKLATFGQIAAGIVHELNNPLTSIVAYSDYLIRKAVSAPASQAPDDVDRLRRISESANRMLRFTRDFVAYARPSSGVAGPVILHGVIDTAVAFCEHVLAHAGVSVEKRYASDVMTVRGVSEQLVQVFVNLLTNASQAAPAANGRIVITTTLEPSSWLVRVVVEDNGGGIAPDHLRQVFLPFFTTKGDRHGTGLGLSIVKSIVDGHEGAIHVESPPGSGARFVLEIPAWHKA